MLVRFRAVGVDDGRLSRARWPAGFNKSGVMIKELGPDDVGLYISNWKNPEYANVLVDETIMLVRKNRIIPY